MTLTHWRLTKYIFLFILIIDISYYSYFVSHLRKLVFTDLKRALICVFSCLGQISSKVRKNNTWFVFTSFPRFGPNFANLEENCVKSKKLEGADVCHVSGQKVNQLEFGQKASVNVRTCTVHTWRGQDETCVVVDETAHLWPVVLNCYCFRTHPHCKMMTFTFTDIIVFLI